MDTRKIAKEFRLAHWAQVIREKNQSGLSAKAFCEQIGICQKTYFYWQKRVREAACEKMLAQPQPEPVVVDNSTIPAGWAVCETAPAAADKTLPIEINGCRVLASGDTDPELLAKTCKVLMSLC